MNTIAQIFPRTGRISGPEAADGAKADVPTTDLENEKKKKHRVSYEAVDAHARRRLIKLSSASVATPPAESVGRKTRVFLIYCSLFLVLYSFIHSLINFYFLHLAA